jgi:hypothetical protein
MNMSVFHNARMYGSALVIAMSSACSASPSDELTPPTQDAGGADFPILPANCSDLSAGTSTGIGPSTELAHLGRRIRAAGKSVYYHRAFAIHAIDVPGGTGAPLVVYPEDNDSGSGVTRQLRFRDFWVDGTSILGAVAGALYSAPSSGGKATLMPGYVAPSWQTAIEDQGYYARHGETVFRTSQTGPSISVIERLSVTGGPASMFVQLRGGEQRAIAIGDGRLYFTDRAEGDEGAKASIFATPLDAAAPVVVARGLENPRLLGFNGNELYLADDSRFLGQLWRLRADGTLVKLSMPEFAVMPGISDTARFTTFGAGSYVRARALYRLPGDAGTTLRDVVLRIQPDSEVVEVAQCFANPAPDPPSSDVSIMTIDLAAGDSALYFARAFLDTNKKTWDERIEVVQP